MTRRQKNNRANRTDRQWKRIGKRQTASARARLLAATAREGFCSYPRCSSSCCR